MNKNLTVAIPTFNRNELLKKNLTKLLPQLHECQLLILDNHSDIPVISTIQELLFEYPHLEVRIIRNRDNIGGNPNIIRCFELCETDWLWILSDRYTPLDDAVEKITRTIREYPDAFYFNFSCEVFPRSKSVLTIGLEEFVKELFAFNFGEFLRISDCVFRASALRGHLAVGYLFSNTFAPHLAILLSALENSGKCYLSNEVITRFMDFDDLKLFLHTNWSMGDYPNLLALGELDLPEVPRQTLLNALRKEMRRYFRPIVSEMLQSSLKSECYKLNYQKYCLFIHRYFFGTFDPLWWIPMTLGRIALRFPRLFTLFWRALKRFRKKLKSIPAHRA